MYFKNTETQEEIFLKNSDYIILCEKLGNNGMLVNYLELIMMSGCDENTVIELNCKISKNFLDFLLEIAGGNNLTSDYIMSIPDDILFDYIIAIEYLQLNELTDLICKTIARYYKKSQNDFSPEKLDRLMQTLTI